MSEIKVGDFVVYRQAHVSNVIAGKRLIAISKMRCEVLEVVKSALHIKGFCKQSFWIHKTHCRKLVKMRKCAHCDGKKVVHVVTPRKELYGEITEEKSLGIMQCMTCNGSGKMKV